MRDIKKIYHNNIGIAFQWEKDVQKGNTDCIQMVFRNTGFYLTHLEIKEFYSKVKVAYKLNKCEGCTNQKKCGSFLLQTPSEKIDLSVNEEELNLISDLLKGTLFQLDLDKYLKKSGLN